MANVYRFQEHNLTVEGEKQDMLKLAELLRNEEGALGDLRYQIEYAFDIDGVRSNDTELQEMNIEPDACYAENHYLKRDDWFYDIMEALPNIAAGDVWATDEEILCRTEAAANAVATIIEELYSKHNGERVVITTGYYDPEEDIVFGTCDQFTGWWYVRID